MPTKKTSLTGECATPERRGMEEESELRRVAWIESTLQDIRFALRALRKSPGFTATAILTLALGIGANTAVFQLLDAVRLRSLPVADPETLVSIQVKGGIHEFVRTSETNLTYPIWEQIRKQQRSLSGVFSWASKSFFIGQAPRQKRVQGLWVSGEMFPTLGVRSFKGRMLTADDDRPGCGTPGAVITYALWQSEFGGEDSAIGRSLLIREHPIEIIGVTPPNFFGLEVGKKFDVALPFCSLPTLYPEDTSLTRRDYFWLNVMGHLKRQGTAQAAAQLEALSSGLMEATVPADYSGSALERYRNFRLVAYPAGNGVGGLRATYDASLWLLLGITGLVLLIACANLANLLLAKASTREREMAVRLALGATRGRVLWQLLSEGLVLAVVGAALGLALANVLSRTLVWFLSREGNALHLDLSVDGSVLGFIAGIAFLTCILFGLAPAFRSSRADAAAVLKTGGRGMTAGRQGFSFQRMLVVSQIAISLVLLAGALLFVRSFWNLMTLNPGFRENGILLTYVGYYKLKIAPERYKIFTRDVLEMIRAIPIVESAATSTHIPLDGGGTNWYLGARVGSAEGTSKFAWVSPRYFETMQTPMIAGRDFTDRDTAQSPPVAIVNEEFVRRFLGGASPLGQTLRTVAEPNFPETQYEIVGVVKDTKYSALREEIPPMCFAPALQFPLIWDGAAFFIRSAAPPAGLIAAVRQRLIEIYPEIDVDFHVFETDIQNGLVRERTMAMLSGFFGVLAALLTMVGLYGVISYIIAIRWNEIGIRMALGASRLTVVRMILRQTLGLLAIGVALGILLSLVATKGASSLLFGLGPDDPLTLAGASIFLLAVALMASLVPAHRASRLEPMNALRHE
jgi:predicted permease